MTKNPEVTFFKKYVRYFVAFIVVVLVVILISFYIVYSAAFRSMAEKRYQELHNQVSRIDDELLTMASAAQQLYYYTDTVQLMRKTSLRTQDYLQLKEYSNFLQLSVMQSPSVANYYIYFPNSQVLFDKNRMYFSIDALYGQFDSFPELSRDDFEKEVLHSAVDFGVGRSFIKDGKTYTVIPYSGFSPDSRNMSIVILLDVAKMQDTFFSESAKNRALRITSGGQELFDGGISRAQEETGYIEYHGGDTFRPVDGFVLTADSEDFDLHFQVLVSKGDTADLMWDIVGGYVSLFGGMALFASIILAVLSFRFSRPFYRLALVYDAQEPALRKYYLNRLLDAAATDAEVYASSQYLAVSPGKKAMACLVRCAAVPPVPDAVGAFVEKLRSIRADKAACVVKSAKPDEACAVFYNMDDVQDMTELLRALVNTANEGGAQLLLGLGKPYEDVRGISVSYLQAQRVMSYGELHASRGLLTYGELPATADVVTLEPELKNKIQVLIAANEPQKAIDLFEQNFNETCRTAFVINPVAASNFIAQTASVLIQSAREIVRDKDACNALLVEVSRLFNMTKPQRFLEQFSAVVQKITSYVPSREFADKRVAGAIADYIDKNYSDSGLSLAKLGTVFSMNESYISLYFKQHTNQNFSQYLEQCRMQHAVELLEKTNDTVNQVLEKVGYTNRNTFYKAFLRVYGVSPKTYKENILREKNAAL